MNSDWLRRTATHALGALLLVTLTGCFDENIPEQNLEGQVVLPASVADDPRDIGMIYLGIYEGFDPNQLGYPYPTTGPRVGDNPIGDALPYGGTSVGEYAYGCYRALQCKIMTGRYDSLESLLEVHQVETENGDPVSAEDMYDQCTYYYGWNSIEEFSFIGHDQLDFEQDDNGDWAADFRAWHTRVPAGAVIWGFADNDATTCSSDQGSINRRRSDDGQFWREGTNFADVLNFADKYITEGDLIVSEPAEIEEGRVDGYRVTLDYVKD